MVVTESTARVEIFKKFFSIINTNKLSNTTVLATFPEKSPTFPSYVVNPAQVSNTSLAIDTGSREINFTLEIDMYGDARDGTEKIDEMKDNVIDTLRASSNIASFKTDKISIIRVEDLGNDQDVFRDMKLNIGGVRAEGVLLL